MNQSLHHGRSLFQRSLREVDSFSRANIEKNTQMSLLIKKTSILLLFRSRTKTTKNCWTQRRIRFNQRESVKEFVRASSTSRTSRLNFARPEEFLELHRKRNIGLECLCSLCSKPCDSQDKLGVDNWKGKYPSEKQNELKVKTRRTQLNCRCSKKSESKAESQRNTNDLIFTEKNRIERDPSFSNFSIYLVDWDRISAMDKTRRIKIEIFIFNLFRTTIETQMNKILWNRFDRGKRKHFGKPREKTPAGLRNRFEFSKFFSFVKEKSNLRKSTNRKRLTREFQWN